MENLYFELKINQASTHLNAEGCRLMAIKSYTVTVRFVIYFGWLCPFARLSVCPKLYVDTTNGEKARKLKDSQPRKSLFTTLTIKKSTFSNGFMFYYFPFIHVLLPIMREYNLRKYII